MDGSRDCWELELSRKLLDKNPDVRSSGGLVLQKRVKEAYTRDPSLANPQATAIIDDLVNKYVKRPGDPTYRKSGIMSLGIVLAGLSAFPEILDHHVPRVMVLALDLLEDKDTSVVHYSCHSMFFIAKDCNGMIMKWLPMLIDKLGRLHGGQDAMLSKSASSLSTELKRVLLDYPHMVSTQECLDVLVDLSAKAKNPMIREFVVTWLAQFFEAPPLLPDVLPFLPKFLSEIFTNMDSRYRVELRKVSFKTLELMLARIKEALKNKPFDASESLLATIPELLKHSTSQIDEAKLMAAYWLSDFTHLKCEDMEDEADNKKWAHLVPDILTAIFKWLAAGEEIKNVAVQLSHHSLKLSEKLPDLPAVDIARKLLSELGATCSTSSSSWNGDKDDKGRHLVVRMIRLQWLRMLLSRNREDILGSDVVTSLLDTIFQTLLADKNELATAALAVLGTIMEGMRPQELGSISPQGSDVFSCATQRLLRIFKQEPQLLEDQGGEMIRHLCGHLDNRHLFITAAKYIQAHSSGDMDFKQRVVHIFNWILLTSQETRALREELLSTKPLSELINSEGEYVGSSSSSTRPLFLELLDPWFFNPVSALSLCLWSQQYEFAIEMITRFASFDPSLDTLRQLDQLVHLLESPTFSRLRLRLMEPKRHPALFKCLLALAMLLPQAAAFQALSQRIRLVQSGMLLEFEQMERQQQQQQQSAQEARAQATPSGSPPALSAAGSASLPSRGPSAAGGSEAGGDASSMDSEYDDPFCGLLKRFDEIQSQGFVHTVLSA